MGHSPDQRELGPKGALVRDWDMRQPHGCAEGSPRARVSPPGRGGRRCRGAGRSPPPCKAEGDQGASDRRGAHTHLPRAVSRHYRTMRPIKGVSPRKRGAWRKEPGKRLLGVRRDKSAGQLGPGGGPWVSAGAADHVASPGVSALTRS